MTNEDEIDSVNTGNGTAVSNPEYDGTIDEALADYGAEEVVDGQRTQYDIIVEVGATEYGIKADETDEGAAALQSEFVDRGAEVYRTREEKVSETARIRGDSDLDEETLEESESDSEEDLLEPPREVVDRAKNNYQKVGS